MYTHTNVANTFTHGHPNRSGIRYRQEFSDFGIKSHICGWPDLTEADYKAEIPRQVLRFMGDNASEFLICFDLHEWKTTEIRSRLVAQMYACIHAYICRHTYIQKDRGILA